MGTAITPETPPARVAQPDARYFAQLYSPETQRQVLTALLGVEHEVTQSLKPGLDHHVAHTRLQWWADECERLTGGHPAHPLTRELARSVDPTLLANLKGLVDVATWDLARATFESRAEVTAYCSRWAAAMSLAVSGLSPQVLDRFRQAAPAMRELELLTALVPEARHGRLRLPLDELAAAGAEPSGIATTPWAPRLAELVRNRHQQLQQALAAALDDIDAASQPAARGLLVWATLLRRQSLRAVQALPDSLQNGRFGAIPDAWTAWRAAQRANRGRFKLE